MLSAYRKLIIKGGCGMTRSELVDRLCQKMPNRSRREIEKIVILIFDEITQALETGNRVELRGFGSFFVKKRDERVGCDPRSGKTIKIDRRHIPFFRAGKLLLDHLN